MKRAREPEDELPSETSLCIDLCLGLLKGGVLRVVWLHQLYALIPNRTLVDREVEELRRAMGVRLLNTPLGQAIMRADAYIEDLVENKEEEAVARFEKWLMTADNISLSLAGSSLSSSDVDVLLQLGWLASRRDVNVQDVYWVSHPGMSKVVTSLLAVRRKVVGMIARTRYKEMAQKDLKGKILGQHLHAETSYYHYDLIGSGCVDVVKTASGGAVFRATKH